MEALIIIGFYLVGAIITAGLGGAVIARIGGTEADMMGVGMAALIWPFSVPVIVAWSITTYVTAKVYKLLT